MNTQQLLEKVQFVVDNHGHQSAVLLGLKDWEQVLTLLEDMEDAQDILEAREEQEEEVIWEQVKTELGLKI
jgi:PHD/YefM family antitoxin component YafN of YafNO toxin-antitoxin module